MLTDLRGNHASNPREKNYRPLIVCMNCVLYPILETILYSLPTDLMYLEVDNMDMEIFLGYD